MADKAVSGKVGHQPMKIGFVSPFKPHDVADLLGPAAQGVLAGIRGVTATPVAPLVRVLHRRGHDLSIFCLDPSVSAPQVLRGDRLAIHVLPKRRARQYLLDFYAQERRQICEAVAQARPEALTAHWTYDHALGALDTGLPTVVTCQDTPLRYAWIAKSCFLAYHIPVAWSVIRRADRLICVSPYTAGHIQKYFRPKCPVELVPNTLVPDIYQRGARRLAGQRPARPFTFCNAGGWGGLKNTFTLLKAFAMVHRQEPAARLVMFGRGCGPGQAGEQWARGRHLQAGVEFRGPTSQEKVLDFLETEADAMVHPSLIEAHPMVLLEAMACGVPVIAGSDSGGVAWTLDDGRCGHLCDVRDARALAGKMLDALRSPDGNLALAARAWKDSQSRFNLEKSAIAYELALAGLAACGPAPAIGQHDK